MPHFTDQAKLKAYLNADQVVALFAKIPVEEAERPFTDVDALITAKTEIEPVDPAGNNHPVLISIASRIVIWNLSGQQQWNDTNRPELDRRETLYKAALDELDGIASGDIVLEAPATATAPEFGADQRRLENW